MANSIIYLEFISELGSEEISVKPCFAIGAIISVYLYIHYQKVGISIDLTLFLHRRLKQLFFLLCWISIPTALTIEPPVNFGVFFKSGFKFNDLKISIQRENRIDKICVQSCRHIHIGTYVTYFLVAKFVLFNVQICTFASLSETIT